LWSREPRTFNFQLSTFNLPLSIVTKTGDRGTTALMFNRRVPKTHPRIEACGAVDELNAALGLARASSGNDAVKSNLEQIQRELVGLMGELATLPEDSDRYLKDGYPVITAQMTQRLEGLVKEIESQNVSFKGWATPGANLASATLDVARTICRRAERRVCELREKGEVKNQEILVYLNRLSDLLWLMARQAEAPGLGDL
jgi:cob(I)alamin adenosyltransferase